MKYKSLTILHFASLIQDDTIDYVFPKSHLMDELKNIPPHNKEAEQSVLGAILIDHQAIIKIADFMRPDDFYFGNHAVIFENMMDLFNKHQPIDLLTLTNVMESKGVLKEIGSESYLAELATVVPTATHIFQYGQIVKQKSTLRKIIKAGESIKGLGYEEDKEISNILEDVEKEVFNISQTYLKDRFIHIKEILGNRYEVFAELHESDEVEVIKGVPSGYSSLDNLLSGFKPSDLVILAARPSMGKTAFALSIALNAAIREDKSVGIFSLEMSKEQLVDRMFCSELKVDSWKLQRGQLDDHNFQEMGPVMDRLSRAPIFIDDSVGSSIAELRAKARRLQLEHGVDMIIVDYLQLLSTGGGFSITNRVQEISEISRSLKALGRELQVPVLALSQLSRSVEMRPNKQPQLSDLRESGAIEQDADVVMMMYREDYYDPDSERKGITDIYVKKHRNGPTGAVELMFLKEEMRFYDIDKQHANMGMPELAG